MPDIESLRNQQLGWHIHWRWDGTTGHPRQLVDTLVEVLQDRGYTVSLEEGELQAEPLENIAHFEGAAVSERRQPISEALREKWIILAVGILLIPILIGLVLIWIAFRPRRYCIGLHWRGEAYAAGKQGEIPGGQADRVSTVSDARLTVRLASGYTIPGPGRVSPPEQHPVTVHMDFQEDLDTVVHRVEAILPQITSREER